MGNTMKIASYNVNGIRAAIKRGLFEWIREQNYDVVCFQETKALEEQVDESLLEEIGYHHYWHSAEKKGYSGVATFSKVKPTKVIAGCGQEIYDREGRVLRTDFGDLTILNCYFPSGSAGEERHAFKMQFLHNLKPFFLETIKERPNTIILGDYNVVHQDIDIHNPKKNDKRSGCQPEEKAWLAEWFNGPFTDAFRHLYPEKQEFSWWSYRAGARGKNKGWRIDYLSVTDNLVPTLESCAHYREVKHSDHCAVELNLDWKI